MPGRVEVLEREAERIHYGVARRTGRTGPVPGDHLADRQRLGRPDGRVVERRHFGGGFAGGTPRMCLSTNAPRSTGEVRFGYAAAISTAPLPSSPQRAECSSSTRRKRLALHVGDAVVQRERSFR
jgi:hypothetical protein